MSSERFKENLSSVREEIKKTIDFFLNDFGEYPEVRLIDEEKRIKAEEGSELHEKQRKWLHNKYSTTHWFMPLIFNLGRFIEILPEEKKKEYELKLEQLLERVKKERVEDSITKETIEQANKLLREFKESI